MDQIEVTKKEGNDHASQKTTNFIIKNNKNITRISIFNKNIFKKALIYQENKISKY